VRKKGNFSVATAAIAIFLIVYFAAWWLSRRPASPPSERQGVAARMGPGDIYPDAARTPGAINPDVTQDNLQSTICNSGWSTKSERPPSEYTTRLKAEQIRELGFADTALRDYEEDHLIPLELGGSPQDTRNLWPEAYKTSIGDGGARYKDKVENYLHEQVCAGSVPLAEAQAEIASDWYAVYVKSVPHYRP
jgi:hypothetical protein